MTRDNLFDRATWLLAHAAAARLAGLDPTTADLTSVAQALRGHPDIVAGALRLLDQADARRAAWQAQEEARLAAANIAERRRKKHARGLRVYIEHLRTDPRWVAPYIRWQALTDTPALTFEAVLLGAGPTDNDLAREVLGARSFRRAKRDRTRLLDIVASRMCAVQDTGAARYAAMLWLRLSGFTGTQNEAVARLEAEVERRAETRRPTVARSSPHKRFVAR